MATWNPAKDPRYADLYDGGGSSFVDTFLKAQKSIQEQEYNDMLLEERKSGIEEKKKSREARSALSEAMAKGGPFDYDIAAQTLAQAGDLEGAMKMQEAKRSMRGEDDPNKELQGIQAIFNIGKHNPQVALEIWNSSKYGQKYGLKTDSSEFAERRDAELRDGVFWKPDPMTGEPLIIKDIRREPKGATEDKTKERWDLLTDEEGNSVYVNPFNPADREKVAQGKLSRKTSGSKQKSAAEQIAEMMGGPKAPEEPGILDRIGNYFNPPTNNTPAPQRRILVK